MNTTLFTIFACASIVIGAPALPLCNYKPGERCGCFVVERYGHSDQPGVCFDGYTKTQNRVWTADGLCRDSGGIGHQCPSQVSPREGALDNVAYCTTPIPGTDFTKHTEAKGCCHQENCSKCGGGSAGRCTLCADGFVAINKEELDEATVYDCVSPESTTETTSVSIETSTKTTSIEPTTEPKMGISSKASTDEPDQTVKPSPKASEPEQQLLLLQILIGLGCVCIILLIAILVVAARRNQQSENVPGRRCAIETLEPPFIAPLPAQGADMSVATKDHYTTWSDASARPTPSHYVDSNQYVA
mmetsp:Transcript_7391/g.12924  ORF Transcript_7391/g.12924 Transcript_7391/m.12924 type:complete len:302 (-) Transcript_7391:174-1079(-)|eukprot:CAMPEP_0168591272 /NCGR_PEP_ID=MMETSP0420-20121227/7042_1 /TAXON_ID=498008 /ORGANISM="Pessonella sp." /LENGTH=301 /DNA_ID=CAMNT_0008627045 /DNA_START=287 /DNA_END=1192 /DNA_ORIENTATION=+